MFEVNFRQASYTDKWITSGLTGIRPQLQRLRFPICEALADRLGDLFHRDSDALLQRVLAFGCACDAGCSPLAFYSHCWTTNPDTNQKAAYGA
jgi:hypothetical protein